MANIINGTDSGQGGLITTGDSSDELQLQTAETTALTITSGQQSAFIAGTASAPAVTTTGDLNTGIYFPAADNIGFTTGGTIRGRWTTDGLCFGSDTAAANALDDYEEGTFTPTSPSAGYTISSSSGTYTKIGRLVHCSWTCQFSAVPASNSAVIVGGLPFTVGVGGFGVVRDNTSTGAIYMLFAKNGETNIELNSMDGIANDSQRTIRTNESYNGTVIYTV